ncbi:MAG: arginase family protein [bacterium]|nr:arginase family protein [bacterium]
MTTKPVVFHFSTAYTKQNFFQTLAAEHIDCQTLLGTDCYCSAEAEELLQQQIQSFSPSGIHFLDSGNYHYVSKFWLCKIQEPFSLVLFDNHTDMQAPGLFDLLSCGSWIRYAIQQQPLLREVLLVGPPKAMFLQDLQALKTQWQGRLPKIHCLSKEDLKSGQTESFFEWMQASKLPVYVSIDKDILAESAALTNWDQGNLSLEELLSWLCLLLSARTCIGADICGEFGRETDVLALPQAAALNSHANQTLYELLCSHCNPAST